MFRSYRKAAIAVGVIAASLGLSQGVFAATIDPVQITSSNPQTIDGWTISVPQDVVLTVLQTGANSFTVEKTAGFYYPNESLQASFNGVSTDAAATFNIINESITNDTGKSFGSFDYLLNNVGPAGDNATFGGNIFVNAIGSTAGDLVSSTQLDYAGFQANGATAFWGSGGPPNELTIDAAAGSVFTLDEASTPGGSSPVPVPAAAWQSLIGLAGLGVFGLARRQLKRRSPALD